MLKHFAVGHRYKFFHNFGYELVAQQILFFVFSLCEYIVDEYFCKYNIKIVTLTLDQYLVLKNLFLLRLQTLLEVVRKCEQSSCRYLRLFVVHDRNILNVHISWLS